MKYWIFILAIILTGLIFASGSKVENSTVNNNCHLQPNSGPCRAYYIKYYYDVGKKKCMQFVWGGCAGIAPFENLKECQNACEK
ncbi:MAG: proteinase inhibitor I4 serpin [Leptospiraceae bacterium]|nr:BPTI/Kunitz domain-containing protein [Leptospiraceae bacterium]MCP5495357.1 proteinase inhibitor I4 serpin [Leptospiraceae bacterium]